MTSTLEEKKKQIKRINKYYIIILILCLIIFLIGISAAYYSMVASEDKDSTQIHTGTLIVNFKDGIEIHNPYLIPRNTPTSITDTTDAYKNKFSVENTGTLDQTFDLYLNVSTNEFKQNSLKYILFNAKGNKLKEGNITSSGDMKLIQNTYLKPNELGEYTLMIWLQETGTNQNDEQAKSLIGTLRVEAIQVKE